MEIVYKKINELKPYKNNPRKNDKAVDKVAESIKQFGFKVPLVITKTGQIVTGHTRFKASKQLGLKEVPCIVADDLTKEQIKAFRLIDNKTSELSSWDFVSLNKELDEIIKINMEDFDFLKIDEVELDKFFESEEEEEEKKLKTIECPKCGENIEI